MNLHTMQNFLAAALILFTGIFATLKNRKSKINFLFFLLTSSAFIWQLGTGLAMSAKTSFFALIATRTAFLGIALIPVFSYHLGLYISGKHTNKILNVGYIIALLFFIPLSWTPLILNGVYTYTWGFFFKAGRLHPFFMIFFIYYMLSVFLNLFLSFKRETRPLEKNRKKYFLIALFIAYIGSIDYLATYGVKVYPFGYLTLICFVLIFAYAILRFRIMDINIALTRTGVFVAVYTLVLGLPFAAAIWLKDWLIEVLGPGWWMMPLGLMAGLATVGPFIYIYISRRAEERLLKEQKRYQNTLKQASLGMTRIRNLRRLLDLITHIITKTVRISYAAIYLYDTHSDKYLLQVSRDKGRVAIPELGPDSPLVNWILLERQPLIYEEVRRQMQDSNEATYRHLEENMRLLTASVIIPSFLEDKFLGFIVLGDKLSGQIYTPDDLNVFQVLASQAALAIENARFFEETKEMQEQIAQAEKMSTLGTMADGLSHQINNRFYALSLIAGDTVDTIKMTDTSKCTPEIKEMIGSINHALERIQINVMQGGEVVKGILKYTRKGEENFEPLTLDQILDGTLEMVQYKVKLSEIDIVRNYPKDIPRIKGNMTQLQEVFFNFIDNAYDAIVERRTFLKESGFRGRITVAAHPKDNKLEIIVEDNGIGIKDDDIKKVFTPFFTTKTSSRRGTGLGLYIINKLITDNHKGKITFESKYKIGTRFIVELPTQP